jgi:CheY-like chemotaxis protein
VAVRILVVDDSEDTRDMMAKLLELEAYAIVTAEDGQAGLRVAAEQRPHLIITDINMPNMNGIEMIRELRRQPEQAHVPIMAITAYGEGTASEAIEAGASCATTKPVQFANLMAEIRRLLRESGSG